MARVVDWKALNILRGLDIVAIRSRDIKSGHVVIVRRKLILNSPVPERQFGRATIQHRWRGTEEG
jgi:hypothetical protein